MSRLWVLGDSFAEIRPGFDYAWQEKVSYNLGVELINVARNGASSEWLSLHFANNVLKDIKHDDILILLVPLWSRVCIWPERPEFSGLLCMDLIGKDPLVDKGWAPYSKEEREAFKSYFMYLERKELTELKTLSLLNWVNNFADCFKVKPLIIETRSQNMIDYSVNLNKCSLAQGNLLDVSVNEFLNYETWNNQTKKGLFHDLRLSHLSKENHLVLAEKITKYFTTGHTVDLQTEFKSAFLD